MARLGCWLGVVLILLSIVAMAALVVLPVLGPFRDNATLMSLQAAINCPAGYTFENEFTTYSRPGETIDAATGYCISPEGERIQQTGDQQGRFILIAMAAFVVPFVVGLILSIVSFNMIAAARVISVARTGNLPFGRGSTQSQGGNASVTYVTATADKIDPKTVDWIKQTTGIDLDELQNSGQLQNGDTPVLFTSAWSGNAASNGGVAHRPGSSDTIRPSTLSERLKQIDDAREQGLISLDEYERLRKSILDDMS
jgi:hypothetical protein